MARIKRDLSFRQLTAIYKDPKRLHDYEAGLLRGIRAAAEFIGEFDRQINHPYRMEDCVLAKFNLLKGRPRKKRS
ncbi:MAG TPA: hypothetical protein VFB79_18635 [Candidatus Angelobacter sp.]|nr:hypothetical protein [Candidatus Angelobacter sp.]